MKKQNLSKLSKVLYMTIGIVLTAATPAMASTPKIVTGTVSLFKAITTWLLILIPVGAGAMFGWHAWHKSMTQDDTVIADINRKMKNVLIYSAVAMGADGLIAIFLAFYK